jgi:hypothetical protein
VPICFARRESIQLKNNDAGWSSSVARWAHNPEVVGSNPTPATKFAGQRPLPIMEGVFCMCRVHTELCTGPLGGPPQRLGDEAYPADVVRDAGGVQPPLRRCAC